MPRSSGLYLPLLAILLSMIARIVAIEWRGKIDDPKWRFWCDIGIAVGSLAAKAILWGSRVRDPVNGPPIGADKECDRPDDHGCAEPGTRCSAGWLPVRCSSFTVPCSGPQDRWCGAYRRGSAGEFSASLQPCSFTAGSVLWTQLGYGRTWTWLVLGTAVVAQLGAWPRTALPGGLGVRVHDGGGGGGRDPIVRLAVSEPGALDTRPVLQHHDLQRIVESIHVESDDLAALIFTLLCSPTARGPWVFRKRIWAESIPPPVGLSLREGVLSRLREVVPDRWTPTVACLPRRCAASCSPRSVAAR